MKKFFKILCQLVLGCGFAVYCGLANCQEVQEQAAVSKELDQAAFKQTVGKGVQFLLEKGQADDGSFSAQLSPAVTSMCTSALIEHGIPLENEKIQLALKFLESTVQPDGGIYNPGGHLRNYETSVALMCFNRANKDGKYDTIIQNAVGFLKGIQWDEGEGHVFESTFYGGQGYGKHARPDLSNTSFFIDALHSVEEDADSAAFQKAMTFISRCQNLETEHNSAKYAEVASADDKGGFIYTGVGEGETKAESLDSTPGGGLRSYASMTYAGLKSFLYAGVSKNDIRVKAAMDWISRHYDLETNPGMGKQGLYYYYHIFAKTLNAIGEPILVDSAGVEHNWRNDLVAQLAKTQNEDGSWINEADRWYEGDPNLVTAYALLALSYVD